NAITDTSGTFMIRMLNPGTYSVRAGTFGYIMKEVPGVVVESNSSTTVNITLRMQGGLDEPVRLRQYGAPPDSVLHLTITSRSGETIRLNRRRQPPLIDIDLSNSGPDTLVLTRPGEIWRTPIVTWDVRTRDGMKLTPEIGGYCGNRNPVQ